MSDVMFYGVLRMPYELAMSDELSRRQFYSRAQEAADRVAQLEAEAERRSAPSSPVADDGLPPLPGPRQAWEFGNAPRTYVCTTDQVRQVQREAYESGRAAGAAKNCRCSEKLQAVQEQPATGDSIEEDMRFQCLLYHYLAARWHLAEGKATTDEATDAFRELITHIDAWAACRATPQPPKENL